MANKQIVIDGLIGFIMFAGLSYLTEKNKDKDYYNKVAAFAWGAPFTFFYLMYITSKQGKKAVMDFNKHALFGTLGTIFLILFSLYFHNMNVKLNVLFSFFATLVFAFIYFKFKLYNKF
jgi:hypothetical protein